jgi:hypothetical protein
MSDSIIVPPDLSAKLDQLHGLYGRDQSLSRHLDGLNAQLVHARILYGGEQSLVAVVNGLYEKLNLLRQLYGNDELGEVLDGIIDRKLRLNRMVELQRKVALSVPELAEFHLVRQQFTRYVANLAQQKPQDRDIRGKNGISKNGL